jgi:ubiquinone/menaquinone biosynthesis C-methylase UbiE
MISLKRQEMYRRRYAGMRPGWRPSSQVYENLVKSRLTLATRALDLGCGRGGVMERLHDRAGLVVGLDPDPRSLSDHRAPALELGCGTAGALPYADETFDLVCASWVLEHLADPARALVEVARVLVPAGRFVFLTPNSRHPLLTLNRGLGRTSRHVVDRIYGRAQADTFAAYYRANSLARVDSLARSAGLERVSVCYIGDPTYMAFNDLMFRVACLVERVTPIALRVHLVGEYISA